MVERFFALLMEEAAQTIIAPSIPQLRAAILAYVDAHNDRGRPFRWVKTADQILDNMRRFVLRMLTGARAMTRLFPGITDPGGLAVNPVTS